MGSFGLVAVSYSWQSPLYHSKERNEKNPYGRVYKEVLERLLERGWKLEQHFPLRELLGSMGDYRSFNDMLANHAKRLVESEPNLTLHDPATFSHHLKQGVRDGNRRGVLERYAIGELHEALRSLCGRVERIYSANDDWTEEISSKDKCYYVAKKLGIPTPQTLVLSDVPEQRQTFNAIAHDLGYQKEFLLKLIPSSSGKGVFLVRSQKDLEEVLNNSDYGIEGYIAQRKIALPGKSPYSIRVVMWGDVVLGAALLVNFDHAYCSNSARGGFALDLAVNGSKPRAAMSAFFRLAKEKRTEIAKVAEWLGINPEHRFLPEPIERYSKCLGA